MNLLFYSALARIPLGIAVALEFTGPLTLSLILSRRAIDSLWVILATAGLMLLYPGDMPEAALDPIGIFFALGAGVCWALYIVFGKISGGKDEGGAVTALGMTTAALVVIPVGISAPLTGLLAGHLWLLALAVAIFSSALPYSLEMIALRRLPTQAFGIMMSLEPALAALIGQVRLNEHLLTRQWLAIVSIIVASAGSAACAPVTKHS